MTWRAYVLDDEPLAVDRLVRLLEKTGRVSLVGSSTDANAGRAFLETHKVDVVFLDINMPVMGGFELLASLREPPLVVFSTAYDEFAFKAFEVNSVDYLLKPVEAARLDRALDKLDLVQRSAHTSVNLQKACEDLVGALRVRRPEYPERLASRLGTRVCFIDVAKVTHLYAEDKLTYAVADGRAYCVDASLSDLERRLDPKRFIRIHRNTLVHVRWVAEVHPGMGGNLILQLRDNARTRLTIARNRLADAKARLGL